MSVVDITTRKPVPENPLDGQLEYSRMEADFARDRELLADAIYRMEVKHYRFTIGDSLHPKLDDTARCPLCEGRFPLRGECFAVWMPKSLGGACRPMHTQCFLGVTSWMP